MSLALAGPVPARLIERYGLDTRWYGRHIDAWGLPVLAPHHIADDTLVRLREQLGALLRIDPSPVPELDRRDVRLVVVGRDEPVSAVPEVRAVFGTGLDRRCHSGFGATDAFPLAVATEGALVHEFGRTLYRMALRHIAPAVGAELATAYESANRLGLWLNTAAGAGVEEYFTEGLQTWFDASRPGPVGGDGIHNQVHTRARLRAYDRPLYRLFHRLYL
ncbi:hypothetical protein [Actinoplanes sp. CA-252034]|uniref:hypothetical protein n=1 Tax=Actinoplanes sp. CA-252034 TaxID=3239906 RepID=UPI003D99CC56